VIFLLDTQLLIWSVEDPSRLSQAALRFISDTDHDLFFSAASLWEVAIKTARGRADFRVDPRELRHELAAAGFLELSVTGQHGAAVVDLPPLHKDPFDRLLVAQAMVEVTSPTTRQRSLFSFVRTRS